MTVLQRVRSPQIAGLVATSIVWATLDTPRQEL
jgi:hypothetical protein